MRFAILSVLLFSGCAHVTVPVVDNACLPGVYRNGDGFWPRSLELKSDGTYSYTQMTDVLEEVGEGNFMCKGGWCLSGHWTFLMPDKIELITDGKPAKIMVFVRLSKKHGVAILEPDMFKDILSNWVDDDGVRYLKKEEKTTEPNKALVPTTTAVTPAACAPVAPAAVAAHL